MMVMMMRQMFKPHICRQDLRLNLCPHRIYSFSTKIYNFPPKCTFFLLQFLEFNLKLSPHQFSPRTQSATKYEVCRWVTNIRFEVWGMWYAMGEKYEVWGMRWVTNVRYLQIGDITRQRNQAGGTKTETQLWNVNVNEIPMDVFKFSYCYWKL